jgi:ribosomal protein L16 Arg81 hydroxylase
LPHLEGAFIQSNSTNLEEREDISADIVSEMRKVMFSERWEIYSFKNFFKTIIDTAINPVKV